MSEKLVQSLREVLAGVPDRGRPRGGILWLWRGSQPVCHGPMGTGSPGVGPSPGLYPGTDPRRGDLASCFLASGCGRLRGGLKPMGLGGLAGRDGGFSGRWQGIAGVARGLTAWGAVRAAFAGQAGLVVGQKGGRGQPKSSELGAGREFWRRWSCCFGSRPLEKPSRKPGKSAATAGVKSSVGGWPPTL